MFESAQGLCNFVIFVLCKKSCCSVCNCANNQDGQDGQDGQGGQDEQGRQEATPLLHGQIQAQQNGRNKLEHPV